MNVTAFLGKISQRKMAIVPASIGVVYLWFGALKFFPGLSPAQSLAIGTIHELTFHIFSDTIALVLLAL